MIAAEMLMEIGALNVKTKQQWPKGFAAVTAINSDVWAVIIYDNELNSTHFKHADPSRAFSQAQAWLLSYDRPITIDRLANILGIEEYAL